MIYGRRRKKAPSLEVAAVSIKILPFWPLDPEMLFSQVDAQFHTHGIIAQKIKFDHIVATLALESCRDKPKDLLKMLMRF